jgi:DNA-binding NarL/FixJ family response regulator
MRVLIADGQAKLRFALRILLQQQPGLQVVGAAADASELLCLARSAGADLAIVAWDLPGLKPGELVRALRKLCPEIYIVILSERQERDAWRMALATGADAFASKANPPARLMAVIEALWRNWRTKVPPPSTNNPASLLEGGRVVPVAAGCEGE